MSSLRTAVLTQASSGFRLWRLSFSAQDPLKHFSAGFLAQTTYFLSPLSTFSSRRPLRGFIRPLLA